MKGLSQLSALLYIIIWGLAYNSPLVAQEDTIEWAPIGAKWWYDFPVGVSQLSLGSLRVLV